MRSAARLLGVALVVLSIGTGVFLICRGILIATGSSDNPIEAGEPTNPAKEGE